MGTAAPTLPTAGPPSVPVGTYQLSEHYSGAGAFAPSATTSTLTVLADPTTVAPGNASFAAGSFAVTGGVLTTVGVTSQLGGTVSGGTVNVYVNGTQVGSGPVAGGSATVSYTPAQAGFLNSLVPGTYTLTETYTPPPPGVSGTNFAVSTATGQLTVLADPTTVVPGDASFTFGTPPAAGDSFTTVGVTSNNGTVPIPVPPPTTVTISLNGTVIAQNANTAAVNGSVLTTVTAAGAALLAGLQPGTYALTETYTPPPAGQSAGQSGTNFAASTATGTLTVGIVPTSVVPGNASVSTNDPTNQTIPVQVHSSNGTVVNGGTVTVTLVSDNTATVIGSAPVVNGTANVSFAIPSLPAGTYQLVETYSGNSTYSGSQALGTLTVVPLPPLTAVLEVASDAAALVLLGNPGALAEIQMFSNVFLHHAIPTAVSALIEEIQTLFPKTDDLKLLAISLGMALAQELQQENPTQ